MSEIVAKIREWGEDDSLIICHRGLVDHSNVRCELCDYPIASLPESRKKAGQKGWHLICRECLNKFFPAIRERGGEVLFKGRFRTQADAKKILPE